MLSFALPRQTWAHRQPAALKFALLAGAMVGLMRLTSLPGLALALLALAGLYASLGRAASLAGLRALRPLFWIILVLLLWHIWRNEARLGLIFALRVVVMVGLANFVTLTTPLPEIVDLVEWLARPLARLGLSPRLPGLAVALVLRFVPVLRTRHATLAEAWRARSPRRAGANVVAPLAFSLLDDADHLADALRARGGLVPPPQSSGRKTDGT